MFSEYGLLLFIEGWSSRRGKFKCSKRCWCQKKNSLNWGVVSQKRGLKRGTTVTTMDTLSLISSHPVLGSGFRVLIFYRDLLRIKSTRIKTSGFYPMWFLPTEILFANAKNSVNWFLPCCSILGLYTFGYSWGMTGK